MASSWKKTRGKQKIDMNIIEIEDEKLVTFSKHRSGGNSFLVSHTKVSQVAEQRRRLIFQGLLDVGEPIRGSGTGLRVATIWANLRRRRFLPITVQPTAEAEKWSSGTSEWLLFGPIYGDEDFCPSQSNLLPKLKNVVSVYIEEEKLIFGGRAYREQWHWPESGYYSGQSTATKISAHHSLTYCRS
ncbi:hypothetical protein V6N13_027549 [Hibiscus sabdariffa]